MEMSPIIPERLQAGSAWGSARSAPAESEGAIGVDLLLYFLAVAEDHSFTKAARRLKIDQSWLSHKIRQLEARVGFNVFDRTTRSVELTANGRAMIESTRKLSQAFAAAQDTARLLQSSLTAHLRIGAIPISFLDRQRSSLVNGFITANPDTKVTVANAPSPALIEKLRDGCLDVAFVSAPFDGNGLESLLLRTDSYSVLLPREHQLAQLLSINARDLAGFRVAMPSEKFNPQSFATYYQPLIDAGAIAVGVPEFEGAIAYAIRWRVPVLSSASPDETLRSQGFVARPLANHPKCGKYLVRVAGHRTPALNRLWEMAEQAAQLKQ